MKGEFDFGNIIKVLKSKGISNTFDEFINSKETEINRLRLNISTDFSTWERINIYLSDNRVIKNVFLFQGEFLFGTRYWADEGDVARDAVEDFVFYPEVFEVFNFNSADILCLERNNKHGRRRWVLPPKRPLDKDILTTTAKWSEIPENKIYCK
jgi:hypothetical protein